MLFFYNFLFAPRVFAVFSTTMFVNISFGQSALCRYDLGQFETR